MRKGEITRQTILDHAFRLASEVGLSGLSIGGLADALGMSKSGLFAHFQSKEGLELAVLDHAAAQFADQVLRPALEAPRGEPRLRALLEHWLRWPKRARQRGGCFFIQAAAELDDRPGPPRHRLQQLQREWMASLGRLVRTAIDQGHLRKDVDPDQMAHDLFGIMLVHQHFARLLEDPNATERTWTAFEALLSNARPRRARS